MNELTVSLDNQLIKVNPNSTILNVAKKHNIFIPTLCYLKDALNLGKCGICLVEIEYGNKKELKRACCTKVKTGMKISTSSKNVINAIKSKISNILSNHDFKCSKCNRKFDCELFKLVIRYKTGPKTKYIESNISDSNYLDTRSKSIVINRHKCIKCGRCVTTCKSKTLTSSILLNHKNNRFILQTQNHKCLDESNCLLCGQCVSACPVDALSERSHINRVITALENPKKHVIVAIAPSVRASIGEAFNMGYGIDVTGKLYTSLKILRFNKVFDLNFGADLTIIEESCELIKRIKNNGPFPMFTSCCPGWIRQVEKYFKELIPNLSSTKSPQQIFGAATKTYYPHIMNMNPSDIFTVTIMPCTAKKFESERDDMDIEGINSIDAVLTARELVKLIKNAKIDFKNLEESTPDPAMGEYSGAGVIFGATGGVMEAALRTAKDFLENNEHLKTIDYSSIRGFNGIKEATVTLKEQNYNIAVINGASNVFKFMNSDKINKKQYHFIEVMSCEGGCINGGGHPHINSNDRELINYKQLRSSVLYNQDKNLSKRKAHENEALIKMYKNYIGKPGNDLAHKIFHISYNKK
ncbi:ferredoxin hydrogenase [Clostridium botulinum]|uniref:ferredoxin hydrogenase n=1 Tax=Clostridium botulinum TaxID=1491 RepID=UPI0004D4CF0E|nr:ferredoxin hydrogenase [Clostridium botulinum]KEH98236.1 ferredoxin [Clostridium botulinum D str. 16868]